MDEKTRRNRVSKGVPAGGQYAAQSHSEAGGVTLTAETPHLDAAAVSGAASLCNSAVSREIGTWQRRVDRYSNEWPDMPEVLVDVKRRSDDFESLDRDEQTALMNQLSLGGAVHLLDPGQRFGNDRITVADGFDPEPDVAAVGLMAQKQITDAGLNGDIALTKLTDGAAEFNVVDGGVSHRVKVSVGYFSLSAESPEDDYDAYEWMSRADTATYGPKVADDSTAKSLQSAFAGHHEYAIMMSVLAESGFKEHWSSFGAFDREARTVDLVDGETAYTLDLATNVPALKLDGKPLHASMSSGFLAHMAEQTGQEDGGRFTSELRGIFRETDRRLIR